MDLETLTAFQNEADDWCHGIFDRFRNILTRLARNQSDSIDEDKPTHVFIHKLFSLLESEKVCLLKKNEIHDFVPQHCIGYEDEAWIDKHRIGIRLTAPYSSERRAAASQKAREQQNW